MSVKGEGVDFDELADNLKQGLVWAAKNDPEKNTASSRDCIAQWDHCQLFRYQAEGSDSSGREAVLIVYALVNRPYILDLRSGNSTIERLLEEGLDVYLLDWGYPEAPDLTLSLDDYINRYLNSAVDEIRSSTGLDQIGVMGICQGGVLSLCYASLYPEKVQRLVTVVTPVDFHTSDNLLSQWARPLDVDLLANTFGNIPGYMLTTMFQSLQPGKLLLTKYLDFINALGAKKESEREETMGIFLAMERWIADSPDLAGTAFREFVKGCFQENRLIAGTFEINGRAIDLSSLPMPVLNIYASKDHLVPPSSSKALASLIPADSYKEIEVPTGHIGMFVSKKVLSSVPQAIAQWMSRG